MRVTRIVKEEAETIGFSKSHTSDNDQHISPVVKERFAEFMHDKITQITFQLLDIYLEKLVKIVPVGDLEVVMISLLTEKLPWKEDSGRPSLNLRPRTQVVQEAEPHQSIRIILHQAQPEVHRPRPLRVLPTLPRLHPFRCSRPLPRNA